MLPIKPSILLAEDDPIAREVILVHLLALGCAVTNTAAVAEAIALCDTQRFDALLLDCQLAGGAAEAILQYLRAPSGGYNRHTPAIAISAEMDDARLATLIEAGFADAMEKPVQRERLRVALSLCAVTGMIESTAAPMIQSSTEPTSVLDDLAGLQACGSAEVLRGLRGLLAAELPVYRAEIDAAIANSDAAAMNDCVHRMKSALGFCGATELRELLGRAGIRLPAPALLSAWLRGMDRLSAALHALRP